MIKQLKNDEDKRLMAASVYLNLYLNSLEEVVKDNGDIHLRESGNINTIFLIREKSSKCWVDMSFWSKFSKEFSLQDNEVKSIITRWVEDTFKLKGIHTLPSGSISFFLS